MRDVQRAPGNGSIATSEEFQDARAENVTAARALAEAIRTTIGPRGRDKMLIADGTVTVTNDGASILDRMEITHPVASLLLSVANGQRGGPGDGTSSTVLFAGELLGEAESLLEDGLHPTSIIEGYRTGLEFAHEALDEAALEVDASDTDRLAELAATTMTGRWDRDRREFLAALSVETARAASRNGTVDLDRIALQTVSGGPVTASELVDGVAINLEESSTNIATFDARSVDWSNSAIAVVDDELGVDTGELVTTSAVERADQLNAFRAHDRETVEAIADAFAGVDVDIVVCQKEVLDRIATALGRRGILVVERTRQDEFDALEALTGAERVLDGGELDAASIGKAGSVDLGPVGGDTFLTVRSPVGVAHTLVLRAQTAAVLDELKRMFDTSLSVIRTVLDDGQVVPGGGATETWMAGAVRSRAASIDAKSQLAVDAFADALEAIPRTLIRNAGWDPIETMAELRAEQARSGPAVGFHAEAGVTDVLEQGVIEPRDLEHRLLGNALEAATLVLRVDDVVAASGTPEGEGRTSPGEPVSHEEGGYPWAIGH